MIEAFYGIFLTVILSSSLLMSIVLSNKVINNAGKNSLTLEEKKIIINAGYNSEDLDIIEIDIKNMQLK